MSDQRRQAAWLAAFGEPTRIALIRLLATGEKTVGVLARESNVEMVNASHHLGIMRVAGLVRSDRDGRFRRYSLVGATATGGGVEVSHPSGLKVFVPPA